MSPTSYQIAPPRDAQKNIMLSIKNGPLPPFAGTAGFQVGGGSRIRTCEGFANRFTVCPGWPLRYPSTPHEYHSYSKTVVAQALIYHAACTLSTDHTHRTDGKFTFLPLL